MVVPPTPSQRPTTAVPPPDHWGLHYGCRTLALRPLYHRNTRAVLLTHQSRGERGFNWGGGGGRYIPLASPPPPPTTKKRLN